MAHIDSEPPPSQGAESPTEAGRPLLSWPAAMGIVLVAVVVILGGGALVLRQFTGANPEINAVSTPAVSAAPTMTQAPRPAQQAPTLGASTPASASTSVATVRPAAVATAAPGGGAAVIPTSISNVLATAASTAIVAPAPQTTASPPDSSARRAAAGRRGVHPLLGCPCAGSMDAGPSLLDGVATGDELIALRSDIDQLRADGRAVKGEVQHQYSVILVDDDEAQVIDDSATSASTSIL